MKTKSPFVLTKHPRPSSSWGSEFVGEPSTDVQAPVPFIRAELCFGLSSVQGRLPEHIWSEFLNDSVMPRFPNGVVVLPGYGQWPNVTGRSEKRSALVLVLAGPDDAETVRRIEDIIAEWKERTAARSVPYQIFSVRMKT